MTMKGLVTCGTPLILSQESNNIVRYNLKLKRLITIGKMDQYEASWPPSCRLKRVSMFGIEQVAGTGIKGKTQFPSFPHINCYSKMQN